MARAPRPAILACMALTVVFVCQRGSTADVDSIRAKYEGMARALAVEVSKRYSRLSELVAPEACGCSYHVCGNEFPDGSCVNNGHVGEVDCGGRGLCGRTKMNLNVSSIRTPNNLLHTSPQLHEDVVRDICMTKGLEEEIKAVTNFTDEFIPWMYFASVWSGLVRTWPLMPSERDAEGECMPYDPRGRPWYKVGTSEPKNVVIVLQASESMGSALLFGTSYGSPTRWDVAKDAALDLVGTLDSVSDRVNIVVFNGGARGLLGDKIDKPSDVNVQRLEEALEGVELQPGADNKAAMDVAFDLLEGTDIEGCQNIIVHIGDGEDCTLRGQKNCSLLQGSTTSGRLPNGIELNLAAVETRQQHIEETSSRAAIFTFTVVAGDDSLARQMACANGGVWSMLDGRGEPLNKMGAYFQYLSFSMEPRNNNGPFAIFSPIYRDAGGLGNVTTVVAPVFVAPRCANGSASDEKLLLGVVGKDVTLQELMDQGMQEAQVSVMINEKLSEARACDEDYKYSICKMQVLRSSTSAQRFPAECPTRRWTPSQEQVCHRFRDRHYLLIPQPQNFSQAQQQCKGLGGRLAEMGAEHADEEQHLLASLAPPDGAWLGLQPVDNEWVWMGSRRKVNATRDKMWFLEPPKNTICRAGFIDPRGILHSIGGHTCPTAMAAICEFNATFEGLPAACQGEMKPVSPEDLAKNTSRGCLESGECTFSDGVEIDRSVFKGAVCDLGPVKSYSSLVCCPEEDLPGECLKDANLQGNATKEEGGSGTSQQIVALGAAFAVTGALFIAITGVLAARRIHHGKCSCMCSKFSQRNKGDGADLESPDVADPSLGPDRPKDAAAQSFGTLQRFLASQAPPQPSPFPPSSGILSFSHSHLGGPRPDGDSSSWQASRGSDDVEFRSPRPPPRRSDPIDDIRRVTPVENGRSASGAHGVVREGVWIDDEGLAHKVAIKTAKDLVGQTKIDVIKKEFDILAAVPPHPNIVWVVGARLDKDPIIVEEWVPGNLEDKIRNRAMTYDQILRISLDVARGLDHLHENRIMHYDVKPENILLDGNECAKLADFTCSRFKLASTISVSLVGTVGYIAPECLLEGYLNARLAAPGECRTHYSAQRIDIYSLGKVMLRCVTGSLDPEENNPQAECLCPDLWTLIRMCICSDPDGRPACKEVVAMLEAMVGEPSAGWDDWRLRKPRDELWSASALDMSWNSQ